MNIFKRIILFSIFVTGILSCVKNGTEGELDVMLNIPESVIVDSGDMELSFRVVGGKAPLATDKFELYAIYHQLQKEMFLWSCRKILCPGNMKYI